MNGYTRIVDGMSRQVLISKLLTCGTAYAMREDGKEIIIESIERESGDGYSFNVSYRDVQYFKQGTLFVRTTD